MRLHYIITTILYRNVLLSFAKTGVDRTVRRPLPPDDRVGSIRIRRVPGQRRRTAGARPETKQRRVDEGPSRRIHGEFFDIFHTNGFFIINILFPRTRRVSRHTTR